MFTKLCLAFAILLAPVAAEAFDIKGANAKLARYVHKTGKCGADSELLATMYGNGDGHVGKPMYCGGVLDTKTPTIAHRAWPCGTRLTITHNGHSVEAVVADRGPYTIATLDLGPAVYNALRMNTSKYVCVNLHRKFNAGIPPYKESM